MTYDDLVSLCVVTDDGCINAPKLYSNGYARFWCRGRDWRGNRLAWTLAKGPVPRGKCVLHRCDNPACINIDHLWLGTFADNNRDRAEKGRSAHLVGELNPSSKLTDQQREWMRNQRFEGL